MPMRPTNPVESMREPIVSGRAVIVAGTGVSIAASRDPATGKPHPQASWAGLLEDGLSWLQTHHHIEADVADAHLTLLKHSGSTHRFISAAQEIAKSMGGVESIHFRNWLQDTIGGIRAHDRRIPDALHALRAHGNILATTNYDDVLLSPGLTPVTWKEHDDFLRAARGEDADKVLFFHGHWRRPETVVLDWESYESIRGDTHYRKDLDAFWRMTTWIYVGCGTNGLTDPDFGLLLERYGAHARSAGLWDYCLVLENECADFQAEFNRREFNILAVPYGVSHDALPDYLRSLVPRPTGAGRASIDDTRDEPITEFLRITDSFFQYRSPGTPTGGGSKDAWGDFRFTAEEFRNGSVHRAQAVDAALARLRRDGLVWLEGPSAGGKTTVCLHLVAEWDSRGCEPLYLDLEDMLDAEQASRELMAHAKPGRMFILDNVHANQKQVCALVDQWKTQRHDSVLVLLGWPATARKRQDYMSGYRSAIVEVAVQPEDWIGVYQSTFRWIRGPSLIPPVPPHQFVKEWNDAFAADLVTFQYALSAGLQSGGNAFQVEPRAADRYVRETYLDPCSEQERRDLFCLAWFSDLGVTVPQELLISRFEHSMARGLVRITLHGRLKNHVRFQPWHPSFAWMLRRMKPNNRIEILRDAALRHPFCVGPIVYQLHQRGENFLASSIFDCTLKSRTTLIDWFGDNLGSALYFFRLTQKFFPTQWPEVVSRLHTPENKNWLLEHSFSASPQILIDFLSFTEQTIQLRPFSGNLIRKLQDDLRLPTSKSRLRLKIFEASLQNLLGFLEFTEQTRQSRPFAEILIKAIIEDSLSPAWKSHFRTQIFSAPLQNVSKLLLLTAKTAEFQPIHPTIVEMVKTDLQRPAKHSQLLIRALSSSPTILMIFLKTTETIPKLKHLRPILIKAINEDMSLEIGRGHSRFPQQALDMPLNDLASFLSFALERDDLKPVFNALMNALIEDTRLPKDRMRLVPKVFDTSFGHLTTFLRLANQADGFDPVYRVLADALIADARLPADRSRLLAQVFDTPLDHLGTFLSFTEETPDLAPVHKALLNALLTDIEQPIDESRLIQAARRTKSQNLLGFLNAVRMIPDAAVIAMTVESDTDCAELLSGPDAASVGEEFEISFEPPHSEPNPAPDSSPKPGSGESTASTRPEFEQLHPQLAEKVHAGIERILREAWTAVPTGTPRSDRFALARNFAEDAIRRLPSNIKRHVGAHFRKSNWAPLRAGDPDR